MAGTSHFRVLLMSRAPRENLGVIQSFRRNGARVRVASSAARALALLAFRPELVLVDLARGASLSPAVVEALNGANKATLVVAIHDGGLERANEHASHLAVDGYCRVDDLQSQLRFAAGAALPASAAIH